VQRKKNKQICFWRNNLFPVLSLSVLLLSGFLYRIYGLNYNYSFWTDENHVAIFVRAILERGQPVLANGYSTGVYQWFQYWLSAISGRIFGLNEFAVRFPSVVFGILTIWVVYLLGKELFNKKTALLAAFLTTFLKVEILWSRQARPYQALQFFYLLGAWFVYKLSKEEKINWRYLLGFLGCGILASLMHGLGLVVFFSGFVYLLIFKFSWFKKKWMLLGIVPFMVFSWIFKVHLFSLFSQIGKVNNLFYYRVFLTHNYLPLCLLATLGGLLLIWRKNYRELSLFAIFIGVQIIIDSFFLGQPFTRYFYPAFSFVVILAASGIVGLIFLIKTWLVKRTKLPTFFISIFSLLIGFSLILFIVLPKNKFTFFPQQSYSLNEDMQEIPEVDWKKVYNFVGEKLSQDEDIILVTNWNDLPIWFLGEGKLDYLVRKHKTYQRAEGRKDPVSSANYVFSLEDFKNVVSVQKKGIFVVDSWDDGVPEGIREYCRENLKKEYEIDRLYDIQPRYWPVEVYSWGL